MYRFRLCYTKKKELIYISHLELQRTFVRAFRRAGLQLAYSGGFNPQPRIVFAAPLAVGIEGKNEFLDFILQDNPGKDKIIELLSQQLPGGLNIKKLDHVELHSPPLSSLVEASLYVAPLVKTPEKLPQSIEKLLSASTLAVERKGKKGVKEVNVRPFIYELFIQQKEEKEALVMLLSSGNQGGARPDEIIDLLGLSREETETVRREAVLLSEGGKLLAPDGREVLEFISV